VADPRLRYILMPQRLAAKISPVHRPNGSNAKGKNINNPEMVIVNPGGAASGTNVRSPAVVAAKMAKTVGTKPTRTMIGGKATIGIEYATNPRRTSTDVNGFTPIAS